MINKTWLGILGLSLALGSGGPVRAADGAGHKAQADGRTTCRIDAKKSRFVVETQTSGLAAMFGHDHKMEFGAYTGTAAYTPGALATGASLQMTVKAESLHLIDDSNVGERQGVEATLRQEVLEIDKYPEITFRSTVVSSTRRGDGTYDVRLTGDLTLHGVRRRMTIPARVSLDDDGLRAIGVFEIQQSKFNITPFSFAKGMVVIRDQVVISFDIVAPSQSGVAQMP